VTKGASNKEEWSPIVVINLVWEAEPLQMWEIDLHPSDIGVGENNSLAKREC
jgi:hypothetical protein